MAHIPLVFSLALLGATLTDGMRYQDKPEANVSKKLLRVIVGIVMLSTVFLEACSLGVVSGEERRFCSRQVRLISRVLASTPLFVLGTGVEVKWGVLVWILGCCALVVAMVNRALSAERSIIIEDSPALIQDKLHSFTTMVDGASFNLNEVSHLAQPSAVGV